MTKFIKRTITRTRTKAKCPICRERMIFINAQFRYCPKCAPVNEEELTATMLKNQRRREKEENVTVWSAKKFSQDFLQHLINECRGE